MIKYTYKGVEHTVDDTITTLTTAQKYLEDNITIEAEGGGATPTGEIYITKNGTYDVTDKATATVNVAGGASQYPIIEGNGEHEVRFVDYDGTLIKVQYVNNGESATVPTLPTHDRLTFVEWNRDFTNVTHDLDVGALYKPTSGNTELFINLTEETGLGITLNIYRSVSSGGITVNWGDGTTSTFGTGTGATALTHTYSSYGEYMISIITTINYSLGGASIDKTVIRGSNEINIFRAIIKCFCSDKINNTQNYAFENNVNLEEFTILNTTTIATNHFVNTKQKAVICPRTLTTLRANICGQCENLEYFIMPTTTKSVSLTTPLIYGCKLSKFIFSDVLSSSSVVGFASYTTAKKIWYPKPTTASYSTSTNFCNYNLQLREVPMYDGLKTVGSSSFYATGIEKMKLPPSLTTIYGNAFYSCKALTDLYIYTDTVPSLSATNAFSGVNKGLKIHVKPEMLSQFQSATNWSSSTIKACLVGDLEGEWEDGYC